MQKIIPLIKHEICCDLSVIFLLHESVSNNGRRNIMKNYVSIDIGGTEIKCARLDEAGNILDKWKVATPHEKRSFLRRIDRIIKDHCVKEIKGLAICAPGKIEKTEIQFGGSLPFLDGVDFAQLYQYLHIPVAVINDGKAAALAEECLVV